MTESLHATAIELPHDAARATRIAVARSTFPGSVVDRFAQGMFRTDVLGDAVVEDFAGIGRGVGWRMLDEALQSGQSTVEGAPASLEAFLAPVMTPPEWFDAEKVEWGAALWWRFFIANQIGLTGALRTGYRYGDLNKPQAMNGRSAKMAARRYEETARWVLSATEPGALVPGRDGFNDTIKIRLVHAMVRGRLRNDPAWDRTAWGEPIHTTGMAMTNNAFLLLPMMAADAVGVEFTTDEREAMRAMWHWIGYLMGIPEPLLPADLEDTALLTSAAPVIFAPADEDTQILDSAIMRAGIRAERILPRPLWPFAAPLLRPIVSRVIWGITATILSRIGDNADDPSRVSHPVLSALRPIVARRERKRRNGELGTDLEIALRQRAKLEAALSLIKAAPTALDPQHAGQAT